MEKMLQNIAIKDRYLSDLIDIFETIVGNIPAKVILYGSRANGSYHPTSDIDLAIKSTNLSPTKFSKIREKMVESHIPYKTDLVNFNEVDRELQDEIEKEGILIWES